VDVYEGGPPIANRHRPRGMRRRPAPAPTTPSINKTQSTANCVPARGRGPHRRRTAAQRHTAGGGPVLVISKRPLHHAIQRRCHHASASARSPPWPPMPRPSLQRLFLPLMCTLAFLGECTGSFPFSFSLSLSLSFPCMWRTRHSLLLFATRTYLGFS
jgi:hypothetical protein